MDVDAISIARHVYVDPALVQHAGVRDGISPEEAFKTWATTFPFGWSDFAGDHIVTAVVWAVPGWALTILATLFGAPFWFDTLQRFVQIRGAGPEPASGSMPRRDDNRAWNSEANGMRKAKCSIRSAKMANGRSIIHDQAH
jgi:hypothetical protein